MDELGNVQFLSREDDLIKSSGYRIGPEEIEEALVTHPSVADAGVVGVPDPVIGQRTKAFVALKAGVAQTEELKKQLVEHCKGKIAVYKLPREIEFIDAMPRTAVGKLLRRELRRRELEKPKA
jgi:2-aminobenzoate-CoA ligase